jgi:hypothetical protein
MRRLTILVLLAALVGLGASCGDDSSDSSSGDDTTEETSKSSEERTKNDVDDDELDSFVEGFMSSSDGVVSEDDARCIGEELLPELSTEGKELLNSSSGDIEDLSAGDQDALFASFDTCISIDVLADSIAAGMTQGADATSSEAATCVSGKIVENYDKSGELMRELLDASGDQSAFTEVITECVMADMTTPTQ